MKLYEIPRGSKLKLKTEKSPEGEMFTFHHIDGSYSYITRDANTTCPTCGHSLDEDNGVVHLHLSTPVKLVDQHYEIDEDQSSA